MNAKILARLLRYLAPYRVKLLLAFIAALFSVTLSLLGPVLVGQAIDSIASGGGVDFAAITRTLSLFLAATALSSLTAWIMQALSRTVSARAAQDMRRDTYARISSAPLSAIDTHRHGDLVSRLVNDADAVAEGFLQAISQLLPGVVTILTTIVVMCLLNLWIALVVIVLTPVSIVFARFVGTRTGRYFREQGDAQGAMSGFINETVGNLPLVQALGYEEGAAEAFSALAETYYNANFKATFYASAVNPGTRFVNALAYAAVGVFGAIYAVSGGITVGGLSVFLSYANQYTKPFNEITAVLTQVQNALASAGRLFAVMDWQTEPPDTADGFSPAEAAGRVTASHVRFGYDKTKPVIHDFTMDAMPGMRVALVGPTGCGKTTLINLLMRFYEIDGGEITVDGAPITRVRRDALRGRFGMVLQDTWLKRATVRENIAYGRPEATLDEVVAAAKAAYAHSFIQRLPNGYDTILSEGDTNLSSGQRQLLCIARVILTRPDMLILDEATSSIDTRTEIALQRVLENMMRGHTSFVVAHRLSTIQGADLILVMNGGRIVEQGTHEALLEKKGFYEKLFRSQFARA